MKTGIVFPGAEGRTRHVGQIRASITIRNDYDIERARGGEIPESQVRALAFERALVDTGANDLCLAPEIVAALGLVYARDVVVETATGAAPARMFKGANLEIDGRERTMEVLELPGGDGVLIGVVPLELMGIELDIRNQRLILLPDDGPGTYLTIL